MELVLKSSTGLWETETPCLKGAHRLSCALGPRIKGKAKSSSESGSNLTAVLGGCPGKTGGDCSLLRGKDIGGRALGNIHQHVFLWKWPFWENLAPPISAEKPQARPNNNPDGITASPISKQDSQAPLISPRDKAPPTRGIGISSTYQWAGISPSHQEAYSKPPY